MKSQANEHNLLGMLSPREYEIMKFVVEGKTSREIAVKLTISPKTVDTYRSRLMHKIKVKNVMGLMKFAIQHDLIKFE